MSSEDVIPVTVRILDKDYQVACPDSERGQLMDSARYLDHKMREIRNSGKVIGSDRVAVMAALNITHDLLECKLRLSNNDRAAPEKLKRLQDKVETTLNRCKQLEL